MKMPSFNISRFSLNFEISSKHKSKAAETKLRPISYVGVGPVSNHRNGQLDKRKDNLEPTVLWEKMGLENHKRLQEKDPIIRSDTEQFVPKSDVYRKTSPAKNVIGNVKMYIERGVKHENNKKQQRNSKEVSGSYKTQIEEKEIYGKVTPSALPLQHSSAKQVINVAC